jgi:SAM-dependent methyltransferase
MQAMEETPCPLCNAEDEEFLFTVRDRLHGIAGQFREVRCRSCGLIYLNPRPDRGEMVRFYPPEYFTRGERRAARIRVKHRIRDLVLRLYYGYPPTGSRLARWSALPLWLLFKADRRNALVIPFQGEGRFLDVGCGSGKMLAFMQERGWTVAGVEIDPALCRGLDVPVHCGELEDCAFASGSFDVVLLSQVLEHLHHPLPALEKARDLLAPGGRLYLRLPDAGGFAARRFRERWFGFEAPRHLCTYTRDTAMKAVEKAGFHVEYVKQDRNSPCLKNTFLLLRREGAVLLPLVARIKPLMRAVELAVILMNRADALILCARKA